MRPRIRPLYLALGFFPACQLSPADTSSFTSAVVVLTSVSDSTSEGVSTTDDPGSSSSTTDEPSTTDLSTGAAASDTGGTTLILDVGANHDIGDGNPIGCKGKIDFLFVISRYAGMEGFQTQLQDAFPKFIDTIEAKFADFDYHIMVVDGDPGWGHNTCNEQCPVQCMPDYPCDYTPTYCDTKIGAGNVFAAGHDAANKPCSIDGGRRYMVTGQTDLKETFACVAQIGSSGGPWLGEALTAAMHSNINDPGGCNKEFLRRDALLMVTLISNTYDLTTKPWGSTGTPETWTAAVREAKGGDLDSVVLLNIGDTGVPGCHEKDRLCQMVEMFPYALNTEVWADDYGPFFDEATDLVEAACSEFIPPQ